MKKTLVALSLGFLVGIGPAQAFNTMFLKDAPAAKFTSEDIDIFLDAANNALNDAADGELREWKNPKTGSSGTIKPLETRVGETGKCRVVEFSSRHKSRTSSSKQTLCQQANGEWKVPAARKKAK